jgi:hypothetical protein
MDLHAEMMKVSLHAVGQLPPERISAVVNMTTGEMLPVGRLANAADAPRWIYNGLYKS